jgi:hypothetical protein
MDVREERIYLEAAALWRELHGDAAPPPADSEALLEIIMGGLPAVDYERLCSPWLRPSTISGPKTRKAD